MNSGVNNKWHSICRPGKHNNRLKCRSNTKTRAKIKLLPIFGRHLEFLDKGITGQVSMGTEIQNNGSTMVWWVRTVQTLHIRG